MKLRPRISPRICPRIFTVLFAAVLGLFAADVRAADPDLVLHYRFDADNGDKVTDLSSHNNVGVNKHGQFVAEVRGRSGVMRLDGEKAVIDAKSKTLNLKGDCTFAMWVRTNFPGEVRNVPVFSTAQYQFGLFNHLNVVLWGNTQHPPGENVGPGWPVDRDILGTDWSHIVIVVAYPRVRFYRNGQLIRDAWMPFSMDAPQANGTQIRFGTNGRTFGSIDLDEAAVFNRALSPAEVTALFAGADAANLPRAAHDDILMEPFWYQDKLTMRLSAYHRFDLQGKPGKAVITLKTADGAESRKEAPATADTAVGTSRTVATADFPINDLNGKAFLARIEVHDAAGKKLGVVEKNFLLNKPDWVHTPVGHTDQVPAPWTPVKVEKNEQGADIHVYGRRYRVSDTPLFSEVDSKGAKMLAEPMTFKTSAKPVGSDIVGADTRVQPIEWLHEKTQWTRTDDRAATFVQTFVGGSMQMQVNGHMEFDGFTRFDCTITAQQSTELTELLLEMPVNPEVATFAYAHNVRPAQTTKVGDTMRTDYSKMNQSGLFMENMSFPFTSEASLGDDERMLVWQAESPAGWNNKDKQKAVEFLKESHAHTIRIRFIDQTTVLQQGEKLTLTFALLATPARPLTDSPWNIRMARAEPMGQDLSWPERTFEGKPALPHVADMQIRAIMMTGGGPIWPYPLPLGNEWYRQENKRVVQEIHNAGMRAWTYRIHQRFSMVVPEYEFNGTHMAVTPFRPYGVYGDPRHTPRANQTVRYGPNSNSALNVCPASAALRDANVHALHKRLTYFGEDGVYLDGTSSYHFPCKNTMHGCGYIDRDGKLQTSRPIFGVREYMKRIYVAVKSVHPDNMVDVHDSFGLNSSGLVHADILSTGERWHHLNKTLGGVPYVASALTLDMARHEFTGRQHNLPFVIHTHRLGDYVRISATTLLMDIPAFPSVDGSEPIIDSLDDAGKTIHHKYKGDTQVFSLICRVRDRFGADDAKRILYYEGVEKYVTIAESAKMCHTTIFIHPTNGVLAFVTNRSMEEQHVEMEFDLDALGLAGKKLEVQDTMYNRKLPIDADGKVSLKLPTERWTYLWIKPVS